MNRKLVEVWQSCGGTLQGQMKVTEKYNTEDLLDLETLAEPATSVPPSKEGDLKGGELVDSRNVITADEESSFLSDVLGPEHAAEAGRLPNRQKDIEAKWDDKPINPQGKVMHPSVEEQFFTEGGKEVKAVHDVVGSLWHVEFIPGGQVPAELKGSYTDERKCRHAIQQYLAKRV